MAAGLQQEPQHKEQDNRAQRQLPRLSAPRPRRQAPPAGWPASRARATTLLFSSAGICAGLSVVCGVTCQLRLAKSTIFCHSAASSGCLSAPCSEVSVGALCALSVCRACSQYESGRKCVAGISSPDLTPQSSSMDCQISLLGSPVAAASSHQLIERIMLGWQQRAQGRRRCCGCGIDSWPCCSRCRMFSSCVWLRACSAVCP